MEKTYCRDIESAAIVHKTARITGFTKRYIKQVIAGDRQNDQILDTYMLFQEGNEELLEKAIQINRAVRRHASA